jgi:hypothetical protein
VCRKEDYTEEEEEDEDEEEAEEEVMRRLGLWVWGMLKRR